MKSTIEVVGGVPQPVYRLPLEASVSPILADLDFARLFNRLTKPPGCFPGIKPTARSRSVDSGNLLINEENTTVLLQYGQTTGVIVKLEFRRTASHSKLEGKRGWSLPP